MTWASLGETAGEADMVALVVLELWEAECSKKYFVELGEIFERCYERFKESIAIVIALPHR